MKSLQHNHKATRWQAGGVSACVCFAVAAAAAVVAISLLTSQAQAWREPAMCVIARPTLYTIDAPQCRALKTSERIAPRAVQQVTLAGPALSAAVPQPAAPVSPDFKIQHVKDWRALEEAKYLAASGDTSRALAATKRALAETKDGGLALKIRLLELELRLKAGESKAIASLDAMARRFARLPQLPALQLLAAQALLAEGQVKASAYRFRRLAIDFPETFEGREAARTFAALKEEGDVQLWKASRPQRLDRAERLARAGTVEEGWRALKDFIEAEGKLTSEEASRIERSAAHLAKRSWHFGLENNYLTAARAEDARRVALIQDSEVTLRASWLSANRRNAEQMVARLVGNTPIDKVRPFKLLRALEASSRAGDRKQSETLLLALLDRKPSAWLLRKYADTAIGRVAPAIEAKLFADLIASGASEAMVAYYASRTSEAAIKLPVQARAEVEATMYALREKGASAVPGTDTSYYGLWSEQALGRLGRVALAPLNSPNLALANNTTSAQRRFAQDLMLESGSPKTNVDWLHSPHGIADLADHPTWDAALAAFTKDKGSAFPWSARVHESLRLGQGAWARHELQELLLAWRQARGRELRRMGFEAVAHGVERPRIAATWKEKRSRRRLESKYQKLLGNLALRLGDPGLAHNFGLSDVLTSLPRPYADIVNREAERHQLDPNLIYAVMRVESVFNPEILSCVGAVGLMQIMPKTGMHIARLLDDEPFTPARMLEPETNIRYAAAYLASLISRFEGRLPLAIASYNGGPHNVAKWVLSSPDTMPVDAFLEHIPFRETHRYVRRVLTHYRAYRAGAGLPMVKLDLSLPALGEDAIGF